MTTAIQTLKSELERIQQAQADCITESGFVRTECRYRYQLLVRKAKEISGSIAYMKEVYR
ncbi:MAG: hypothetical protein EOM23_10250 [Candidatus Moranbacteria bacterium]|nr:hypothetical protein [Candidatus Moranbacteria bacterium]